jgi:hypothetical protein
MATRMPKDLEFSDEIGSMIRMWYFPEQEQELMQRWFASTGAEVSGWGFPTFGLERHDPTRRMLDPLSWNLTVTVKDFPTLLEWLQKLPEAPRFMQLGSVSVHGPRQPGQRLTASVPVTVYMWTGVEPPRAAIQPAEGAAPVGGGPGMGRGMAGGGRGMMGGGRGMMGGGRGMGGPRGG